MATDPHSCTCAVCTAKRRALDNANAWFKQQQPATPPPTPPTNDVCPSCVHAEYCVLLASKLYDDLAKHCGSYLSILQRRKAHEAAEQAHAKEKPMVTYPEVSVPEYAAHIAGQRAATADYASIADEVAKLVEEKQAAYGDSFGKSGEVLRILYPDGIPPEKLADALTITRVVDKLFRIATKKDALGESPWRDIMGYALLAVARDEADEGEDDL